jgi:hypothetical protein
MRRIILAVSLVALCPILRPATAQEVVAASPTQAIPVQATAEGQNEPPDIVLPPGTRNWGDWLWDLLMDRLTIPLGPAEQDIWPHWAGRERWFIADRGSDHPGVASEEQTQPQHGFFAAGCSRIVSSVPAAPTGTRAGTLVSETAHHVGEHTWNSS